PSSHESAEIAVRARARDVLLGPPGPGSILQVLHADDLSAPGPRVRAEVRDQVPGLVQRRPRLGLRQRDPARAARLCDPRPAGGRRGHSGSRPSGRGMALRAPSFDVPAGADGRRPRIPRLTATTDNPTTSTREEATMDTGRNDQLGELAADAALERADFLVQATDQFRAFVERHRDRIAAIGGLTLIDEDPEYLSIAPDLTFRSRSRFQDEDTGEWVSETEVIESAAEVVELYNPADLYTAFAEAARELAGLAAEPTAAGELLDAARVPAADSFAV